MRQYHLPVAVFSADPQLARLVQSIHPPEGLALDVTCHAQPDLALAGDCRVVVWDLPGLTPAQLRAGCADPVKLVYCAGAETLESLPPEELEKVDVLLEKPLRPKLAAHSLEGLTRLLGLDRERRLAVSSLETVLDSLPDMVWFKSLDGTHAWVNQGFCAVVGKPRHDVIGRDHCYIWDVSPDDPESGADSCRESEDAVIAAGRTLQSSEQVKGSNGMRQLSIYKSPLYDIDGAVLGTTGIGRDITRLENMITEIDILLQGMPYAVLLRDENERIFDANRKFEEDFGLSKAQIVGQQYGDWSQAAFFPERARNTEGYLEGVTRTGRTMELRKENIYNIFDQVVGQVCIFRDVTVERQLEAKIIQSANTDFLTGLYNRRSLYQHLRQHCQGQNINLFYVDLDHFKSVNDLYGHKVGDEALVLTAQLLRESFPQDFVARMGGDEFLIVKVGDVAIEELEREARALLQRLRDAYAARPDLSRLSASIGITRSEDAAWDTEDLIRHSDAALYRAKGSGRDRFCVYRQEDAPAP